jgi:phosphocarrier protein HPr
MPSTTVTVGSAIGLHARPAALIAEPVDAGSALMIMTLGATKGTEVTVESEDQAALDKIAGLVASDLDA